MPHAHNNFLEITVETGITGLILFLTVQIVLTALAIALILKNPRRSQASQLGFAVLGFLVAIHAFGMTNFSLRRTVGFQIWLLLGLTHGLMLRHFISASISTNMPHETQCRD
jgi:O-antigen ligase